MHSNRIKLYVSKMYVVWNKLFVRIVIYQCLEMCLKLRHNSYMYLMCLIWGTSEAQKGLPLILSNFSYPSLQYSIQLELVKNLKIFIFLLGFSGGRGKFLHYFAFFHYQSKAWVIRFPKIYNMSTFWKIVNMVN